ncbi:MAG: hypothetical protein ACFCUQ_19915 [Kiloniellales bacterium]
MGCAHIHDFITGATIALAAPRAGGQDEAAKLDIVRPNLGAAALVAHHLDMLESLVTPRDRGLPVQ